MKMKLVTLMTLAGLLALHSACYALDVIKLKAPVLDHGTAVMRAMKARKTTRELLNQKLSLQQLSELLWAAGGVSRDDGRRTAPSAMNVHPVDVFVVLPEGIYHYEPDKHQLSPVVEGDFRKQTGTQDFVATAPVNLVYVADFGRFKKLSPRFASTPTEELMKWVCLEVGHQSQNVYLYCASEKLGATFRVSVDRERLGKLLKLHPGQAVIAAQTVGIPR